MELFATKQEPDETASIEHLNVQIEAQKKLIEDREGDLQAKLEKEMQVLAEKEAALKEAHWKEKVELAEKKIGPLYRKHRQKEKIISEAMNKLFQGASKKVEDINAMFGELEGLKKEISKKENSLIRKDGEHDVLVKDAIELNKVQIDREIKAPQQIEGALSLIREVNRTKGLQGSLSDMLIGRKADMLSSYAGNIYTELMENRSRIIKMKEEGLVKLAGIAEPRIIKAREELQRSLKELEENDLISYEKNGVDYVIRSKEV